MRRPSRRWFALTALLALASPIGAGGLLALHELGHDDRAEARARRAHSGLDVAWHGHAHLDGTPAHEHPLFAGAVGPLGDPSCRLAAPGDIRDGVFTAGLDARLASPTEPPRDPPPRLRADLVLRI